MSPGDRARQGTRALSVVKLGMSLPPAHLPDTLYLTSVLPFFHGAYSHWQGGDLSSPACRWTARGRSVRRT